MGHRLKAQGKVMSPQIRDVAPGRPVMHFALVSQDDKGNQTWHSCAAWGDVAQRLWSGCEEGTMIQVEARVVSRPIGMGEDRRIITENIVSEFKILKA